MLGKLMKYEIKATARLFLPLYAALLVFSLINRFLNPFAIGESINNINLQFTIRAISMTAYVLLLLGTLVMTVVIMIQRFYKKSSGGRRVSDVYPARENMAAHHKQAPYIHDVDHSELCSNRQLHYHNCKY